MRSQSQTIGPYTIGKRLGAGGMGEVYQAYDQRLERWVALKLIRSEHTENEKARERFRREARAAARLSHPSIVQIYDIVESEESDAIVLELVEGEPLSRRIARGPLPVEEAVRLGRQIAEGLAAAHARGIIHRDLKPENVMVTAEGHAKILDFGLAKRLEGEASLTEDDRVVGTFRSMSPEQARGLPLDHRSDLFSLGILLYEALSGRSPFEGGSTLETLTRICSHRQIPLRTLNPEIPGGLSSLVDHLLEKDPALRPSSAREVMKDLVELTGASVSIDGEMQTILELPVQGPSEETEQDHLDQGGSVTLTRVGERRSLRIAALAALPAVALGLILATGWRYSGRSAPDQTAAAPVTLENATPHQLYQQGMADLERFDKQGHVDRAVESFQRALALDEKSAPALAGLARSYWRKYLVDHDPAFLEQALAAARQAVSLDEHLAAARVSLGLVEVARRQYPEAKVQLEQARVLDPASADTWRGLADIHMAQDVFVEAESAYKEAILRRPGDRELHDLLGALHYRTGRYQEAEAAFRRSAELAPDSIFGYRNLAAVFFGQGRYDEAAAEIQKALQIQPLPSLYSNLGTLLFYQGLYPQSVSAFEKALEVSGGAHDYQLWAHLGDAYRWTPGHQGKAREAYSQAVRMLRETLASNSGDVVLRCRLATYLAKLGQHEDALSELRKIGAISKQDADSLYLAASTFELVGRRKDALEALGRALRASYSLETVRRDPELVELRSDPGFHRLLLKVAD